MITGSISYLRDINHNYHTDFKLYPKVLKTPQFLDTPIEAFNQRTWISEYIDLNTYTFKKITPSSNTVGMLEGTAFSIEMLATDPSNLLGNFRDDNVTYIWKKDGAVLYSLSSQNNLKGTNKLIITSESCTRDISGTYELEATNKYGTTISEPIIIDVINRKYHPYLYKNLIVNSCGELGANAWSFDSDITVKNFTQYNKNQWSIPLEIYKVGHADQPDDEFEFSFYPNETALSRYQSATMDTAWIDSNGYAKWIVKNFHPCIVATDGAALNSRGSQDNFFPSWDYIDIYNSNNDLYKLSDIVQLNKTYITREKIKFASYGGKAKSTAYQDIDITEASGLVDGEVYGIDRIIAHFFAYVGIGLSSYEIEYVDSLTGKPIVDNPIPTTLFNYKLSVFNGRPTFIPKFTNPNNLTLDSKVVINYDESKRNKNVVKIKPSTVVKLKPLAYDKTDIRLDFIDANSNTISSEIVPGPTEKDIWAVKEKFFVPYYIGNLYGWTTDATNQVFQVYSQSYTTIDAIRGTDNPVSPIKDAHAEWIQRYHYRLIDAYSLNDLAAPESQPQTINLQTSDTEIERISETYGFNKSFVRENTPPFNIPYNYGDGLVQSKFDRGASAFFAVQKDVVVPKGTRTVRVNILFSHESEVLYDANPKLKNWYEQTIYYDYYTRAKTNERLVNYGNPRCAVTATHLSLHPNNVIISNDYSTYKLELSGSVWQQEIDRLANPNEYLTALPKTSTDLVYRYSESTIPIPSTQQTYENPLTVSDLYGFGLFNISGSH